MNCYRKLIAIMHTIHQLWHKHKHHHPHPHGVPAASGVITSVFNQSFKIEGLIMSVSFSKTQKVTATLTFFAADGVTVTTNGINAGTLVWSSSDPTIFTVSVADPVNAPTVAIFMGVADGTATINWTAVNTAGTTISGSDTVTISDVVTAVPAITGTIAYSAPVSQ